jgi:hypothetical protein
VPSICRRLNQSQFLEVFEFLGGAFSLDVLCFHQYCLRPVVNWSKLGRMLSIPLLLDQSQFLNMWKVLDRRVSLDVIHFHRYVLMAIANWPELKRALLHILHWARSEFPDMLRCLIQTPLLTANHFCQSHLNRVLSWDELNHMLSRADRFIPSSFHRPSSSLPRMPSREAATSSILTLIVALVIEWIATRNQNDDCHCARKVDVYLIDPAPKTHSKATIEGRVSVVHPIWTRFFPELYSADQYLEGSRPGSLRLLAAVFRHVPCHLSRVTETEIWKPQNPSRETRARKVLHIVSFWHWCDIWRLLWPWAQFMGVSGGMAPILQ